MVTLSEDALKSYMMSEGLDPSFLTVEDYLLMEGVSFSKQFNQANGASAYTLDESKGNGKAIALGIAGAGLAATGLVGGVVNNVKAKDEYVNRTETSNVGRQLEKGETKPSVIKSDDGTKTAVFTNPVTKGTVRSVMDSDLTTTRSDDYGQTTYTVPIAGTKSENPYSTETQLTNVKAVVKNAQNELDAAKKAKEEEHKKIGTTDTTDEKISYVDKNVEDASSKLEKANKWMYGERPDGTAGTEKDNAGMNGLYTTVKNVSSTGYGKETKAKYDTKNAIGHTMEVGGAAAGIGLGAAAAVAKARADRRKKRISDNLK